MIFDDSSQESRPEIREKATEQCKQLAESIDSGDESVAIERLIEVLLGIRNARVHASMIKTAAKLPVGGISESRRISVETRITDAGEIELMKTEDKLVPNIERHDYEIYTVAEILLSIAEIVISAKSGKPLEDIQEWVRSRVGQLAREIYERVQSWEPDVSRITGNEGQKPDADAAVVRQLIDALSRTIADHEQRLKALEGI